MHRVGDGKETLGPDLAKIGSKYKREQILESILEPSKLIDPKFAAVILQTKSGDVLSGIVASKTETELVLRDAEKDTKLALTSVERMVPQQKSLMPRRSSSTSRRRRPTVYLSRHSFHNRHEIDRNVGSVPSIIRPCLVSVVTSALCRRLVAFSATIARSSLGSSTFAYGRVIEHPAAPPRRCPGRSSSASPCRWPAARSAASDATRAPERSATPLSRTRSRPFPARPRSRCRSCGPGSPPGRSPWAARTSA
jgi:putative heme-binding domain-containing protein